MRDFLILFCLIGFLLCVFIGPILFFSSLSQATQRKISGKIPIDSLIALGFVALVTASSYMWIAGAGLPAGVGLVFDFFLFGTNLALIGYTVASLCYLRRNSGSE